MARAGHVTDDLKVNLTWLGTEILLLQEPHTKNCVPVSLGRHVRILTANKEEQYPWAAVAITNQNLLATNLKHLGNDKIVIVEIIIRNIPKIYVISG